LIILELPVVFYTVLEEVDTNGEPKVDSETDFTTFYIPDNTAITITPSVSQSTTSIRFNNAETYNTVDMNYIQLKKEIDEAIKISEKKI